MNLSLDVLTAEERQKIHDTSMEVLATTGMRIESSRLLDGLDARGAQVDHAVNTVRFPERLIEDAIENNRRLLREGKKLHLLNGVTSEITGSRTISAKISGGCETYLDWEARCVREADAGKLLDFVRLGEAMPDIGFVGNPIVMTSDLDGCKIEERMRRILTAALVAKNTRKVGSMEIWDERELDFMVEIGTIVRGSREAFFENPCLVTAKETISPLHLDESAGNILLACAERGLPCTIIPMPISGLSAPVVKTGAVVMGNAEILGVLAAIQSVCPEAPVGGGTISGVLDMQTSAVSFSAPEAILQDLAIAEVHGRLYGFNYLIGSGYTDAKFPNAQLIAEKTMKFLFTFLSGRYSYPVGLVKGGAVFSAEQALVDLEICRYIHGHCGDFGDFDTLGELAGLIDRVGIRGNFLAEEHTLEHFRENWFPQLFDRSTFISLDDNRRREVYRAAHEKIQDILAEPYPWEIDRDRARAIDEVVKKAEEIL